MGSKGRFLKSGSLDVIGQFSGMECFARFSRRLLGGVRAIRTTAKETRAEGERLYITLRSDANVSSSLSNSHS